MRASTVYLLVALALAAAFGAIATLIARSPSTSVAAGQRLFPGLEARLNDVAEITIATASETVLLVRKNGVWIVPERDNYPARIGDVRNALLSLARIETVDAKTRQDTLYTRLDLDDVAKPNSKAIRVTIKDGADSRLGDVLIGKTRTAAGGDPSGDRGGSIYVRIQGDAQSWLATGPVEIATTPLDWVDRAVADIPLAEITKVVVTRPDGDRLIAARPTPDAQNLAFVDLPAGMAAKSGFDVTQLGGVLESLFFDDVAPAAKVPLDPTKPLVTAAYTLTSGMVVTAKLVPRDGVSWAMLEATGEGEAAEKLAASFNVRTVGWVYKLPSFKISKMDVKRSQMIEPIKKEGS